MRGSVAAELVVLRKRTSTWILLGIWAALSVFFAYVLPYTEELTDESLAELIPEGLAGNLIRLFPVLGGVFALMLGVLAVGSEYGWDTLKTIFTQGPGRLSILAAKLLAIGVALLAFVAASFVAGVVTSAVIAQVEDAPSDWPSAWLLVRTFAAGWFILAAWAAIGVMLAVLSRGTALAIGISILYALVFEGLISALVGEVDALEPFTELFLRSNAYSLATALGTPPDTIADAGPASFSGPFVGSGQAVLVLAVYLVASVVIATITLRRRDVLSTA